MTCSSARIPPAQYGLFSRKRIQDNAFFFDITTESVHANEQGARASEMNKRNKSIATDWIYLVLQE
jgi:hypothetical protein